MEPPSALPINPREQKRTRFNHTDEEWATQREAIRELYVCRKHSLKETMTIMRDTHGFQACERKYKAKIKHWGFEKHVALSDMKAITAKVEKRAREEGKDTLVLIGGIPMHPQRLETFKKRKFVKESIPGSPGAETPTNLTYQTPESGNPDTPGPIFVPEPEQPDLSTQVNSDVNIADLEAMKRVLGEEHPSTLATMDNLVVTYSKQRQWTKAEKLGVRIMETKKRVLGPEHLDTLTAMDSLATTYWNQGRWTEAEKLEIFVMEARKRRLGEKHFDTLTSMEHLAVTYQKLGWLKEAEELQIFVMEARKKMSGQEDPGTLSIMGHLATTYWAQGRWMEAEKLYMFVMEVRKRRSEEEHPDTLTTMGNLAMTYGKQGRWIEAEKLGVQALETSLRVLGQEHPATLTNMGGLALTYWGQGRWEEAEDLDVLVMKVSARVLGQEHPDTLTAQAIVEGDFGSDSESPIGKKGSITH